MSISGFFAARMEKMRAKQQATNAIKAESAKKDMEYYSELEENLKVQKKAKKQKERVEKLNQELNPTILQRIKTATDKIKNESKGNKSALFGGKESKPSMFDSPGINFGGGSGADAFGLGQSPFSSNAKKTKK